MYEEMKLERMDTLISGGIGTFSTTFHLPSTSLTGTENASPSGIPYFTPDETTPTDRQAGRELCERQDATV